MREEILNEEPKANECFVYNIDSQDNPGTHWTCSFIKNNNCWYFDSYGFQPPLEFLTYTKNVKNRWYNTFKIQSSDEVICGHYCLYVLFHLSKNVSFFDILFSLL